MNNYDNPSDITFAWTFENKYILELSFIVFLIYYQLPYKFKLQFKITFLRTSYF